MSQLGTPDPEQDRGALTNVDTIDEEIVRERLAGVIFATGRGTRTNPRQMHIPTHAVDPDAPADERLCANRQGASHRRAAPETYPGDHADLCERCKRKVEQYQVIADAPLRATTTVHKTGEAVIPRDLHRAVGVPSWLWVGADGWLHLSDELPAGIERIKQGKQMTDRRQAYERTADRNKVPRRMVSRLGGSPGDTVEWWHNAGQLIGVIRS